MLYVQYSEKADALSNRNTSTISKSDEEIRQVGMQVVQYVCTTMRLPTLDRRVELLVAEQGLGA